MTSPGVRRCPGKWYQIFKFGPEATLIIDCVPYSNRGLPHGVYQATNGGGLSFFSRSKIPWRERVVNYVPPKVQDSILKSRGRNPSRRESIQTSKLNKQGSCLFVCLFAWLIVLWTQAMYVQVISRSWSLGQLAGITRQSWIDRSTLSKRPSIS